MPCSAEARAAGVAELDMADPGRKDWLKRGVDRASDLRSLEPAIDPALDWLAGISLPIRGYDGPLCLVHTDLGPGNLIVEPQTGRLTGILDWTDTFLGDAAGDFAALVRWRGWAFTEEVLRSSMNSSFPPAGPRVRNSEMTTPLAEASRTPPSRGRRRDRTQLPLPRREWRRVVGLSARAWLCGSSCLDGRADRSSCTRHGRRCVHQWGSECVCSLSCLTLR